MSSLFQHRIILVVPAAKAAAVVAWLQANVDPAHDANLGPGLSPGGNPPATHRWMCGSYVDSDCRQILQKLCQLASVTPPTLATWNGWTQAQKIAWLAGVRAGILSGYGAYVGLADNTHTWDDPQAVLAALGLQPVG